MTYNTEPQLWKNLHAVESAKPILNRLTLRIIDGSIHDGKEYLGRFRDDTHAKNTLLQAGWTCNQSNELETFTTEG